jgi:CRP-like cAMP-binding protein
MSLQMPEPPPEPPRGDVWMLFKDSLWSDWPEYQAGIAQRLTPRTYQNNQTIYARGDPADYLYLITDGRIEQTLHHEGRVWFRRVLGRGQFFGQFSLFGARHETEARAIGSATVYTMTAADLRAALERKPLLRETLLRESLAGRLRSLPIFKNLSDWDIRWLALLVQEQVLAKGVLVPLETKPGLWVIDWGQVAVTGPAAFTATDWRLTAGNFFLTPAVAIGANCAANTAVAALKSKLLYLPEEHFTRMAESFPDVRKVVSAPLNIADELRKVPHLAPSPTNAMTDEHLRHLAQFCSWGFVPAKQNITTQGDVGYSLVLLCEGQAVVNAVDNEGRRRPHNLLRRGQSFGFTSLLESKRRDATVRSVTSGPEMDGAVVIMLDRRDVQYAFAEKPELWRHHAIWLYHEAEARKEQQPAYEWIQEGETVLWRNRSHLLWLAAPLLILLFIWLLVLAVIVLGAPFESAGLVAAGLTEQAANVTGLEITLLILTSFIVVPLGIWVFVNYFDDYYVVTTRRVTRRDRRLLSYEARADAPIEMVQDATVNSTLWGRLFDYGDLTIRTAAKVGALTFNHVPQPDLVRDLIMSQRGEVLAASRGQTRELLRRGLLSNLQLAVSVPNLDQMRALGPDAVHATQPTNWERVKAWIRPKRLGPRAILPAARRRDKPDWVRRVLKPLPPRVQHVLLGPPVPPTPPLSGQQVFRKHWVNFLSRTWQALLATIIMAVVLVPLLGAQTNPLYASIGGGLLGAWLVLTIAVLLWLWWKVEDYLNDIYVVTDDRLIDIEQRPLMLRGSRKETTLDRVQTVNLQQNGLWANLFDYGNVEVQTAAADGGFVFKMISAPKMVQRTIFQKLDAYRRSQDEKAATARQRELMEGLEVYHELNEDRIRERRDETQ